MATKFIKYENALVEIAGKTIFANSASLGVEASLEPVSDVDGSVLRYAPNSPVKGSLSFSHYCTGDFHDFLNPITAIEHTGEPFMGSFAGVNFTSGYIKSLSFEVQPFQPIIFNSEIDIYGELTQLNNNGSQDLDTKNSLESYPEDTKIAHSLRSFLAGDDIGINKNLSFSYSSSADRNPVVTIGNELPYRVTKENVSINMTVNGEDFGNVISYTGNNAAIVAKIYDVYGESALFEFGCTGQIYKNNLSAQSDGYVQGDLSVSQEYLTGKAAV